MVEVGRDKDLRHSHQPAGEAVFIARAVQDDAPDHPKGLRVSVHQQILWVSEAGQVPQPETTDRTD